jgi:glutamate formiminotransferase/formiminotetrahydrofolate cyclodeaminase
MTTGPQPLLDDTVNGFLDRLADRTPTPGGGAVAALAGALAAAMARMVGAYSINKRTDPDTQTQVTTLCDELARGDRMLRRLVAEDAAAYQQLADARRATRDGVHDADTRLRDALAVAVAVPLEIVAVAVRSLSVMQSLALLASPYLLSDLGVAAVMADACAHTAAYSVRVNLVDLAAASERDTLAGQLRDMTDRARTTRQAIETALPPAIRPQGAE